MENNSNTPLIKRFIDCPYCDKKIFYQATHGQRHPKITCDFCGNDISIREEEPLQKTIQESHPTSPKAVLLLAPVLTSLSIVLLMKVLFWTQISWAAVATGAIAGSLLLCLEFSLLLKNR